VNISKTPEYFPEDRLLYSSKGENGRSVILPSTHTARSADALFIERSEAYTVILHAVQMPSIRYDNTISGDILVVLDAEDGRGNNFKNLAVYYQEGAQPNTCLNLHDLSIFTCPGFDPNSPPYFRIQVIDVDTEDNKLLSGILGEVRQVSDMVGDAFANPFSPIISLGLKIGELAAQLNRDDTIMDFSFQLYEVRSDRLVAANELKSGLWVAVGFSQNGLDSNGRLTTSTNSARERGSHSSEVTSALRKEQLFWDETERRLVIDKGDGHGASVVDAPVLVFEIVKGAQYAIPSAAKRTLGELQQMLDADSTFKLNQIDAIGGVLRTALVMDELNTSLQSFAANDKLTLLKTTVVDLGKSEGARELPSDADLYFMRTVRGFADNLKVELLGDPLYQREIGVVMGLQFGPEATTVESLLREARLTDFMNFVYDQAAPRLTDEGEAFLESYKRRDALFRNVLLAEQLPMLARNATDARQLGGKVAQALEDVPSLQDTEPSADLLKRIFYRMRGAILDTK
jgi:hypothetical protein